MQNKSEAFYNAMVETDPDTLCGYGLVPTAATNLYTNIYQLLGNGSKYMWFISENSRHKEDEAILDQKLAGFKTIIARFDAAAVAAEVEEARQLEAEMARQARKELRDEKKAERKEKAISVPFPTMPPV